MRDALQITCKVPAKRLRQSCDSGKTVEACIKTQDLLDTMLLHDRQMQRVPGGKLSGSEHDSFSPLCRRLFDRQDLVDHTKQSVKCRLDRVTPVDCDVTMENFL